MRISDIFNIFYSSKNSTCNKENTHIYFYIDSGELKIKTHVLPGEEMEYAKTINLINNPQLVSSILQILSDDKQYNSILPKIIRHITDIEKLSTQLSEELKLIYRKQPVIKPSQVFKDIQNVGN